MTNTSDAAAQNVHFGMTFTGAPHVSQNFSPGPTAMPHLRQDLATALLSWIGLGSIFGSSRNKKPHA